MNARFKNVLSKPNLDPDPDPELIPPSSASCIPGTATRPSHRDAIPATPSARPRHRYQSAAIAPPPPSSLSSPLFARILGTIKPNNHHGHHHDDNNNSDIDDDDDDDDDLAIPDSVAPHKQPLTYVVNRSLFKTPTKPRMRAPLGDGSPAPRSSAAQAGERSSGYSSIYRRLGWDDDDDDVDELATV